MPQLQDHPQRYALTNELHARPFVEVEAPHRVSHLAMLGVSRDGAVELAHLMALCRKFDVARPAEDAIHFTGDFGTFRLKWERHTEFTTYTFFRQGHFEDPFEDTAAELVPDDWLTGLPGTRVVAIHLAMAPVGRLPAETVDFANHFVPESLCRGRMLGGAADVTTDFRIHADGFSRILVNDRGLLSRQGGRLVQRLLEVDTYRAMAMLALPPAREESPGIRRIDDSLTELTDRMRSLNTIEGERQLLDALTSVSAEVEESVARTSYRFSAANAYTTLVGERVQELREESIEDYPTLGAFVERRFAPAMRTCASVAARQTALAERATRAGNLLRTRVDIKLEGQNRDLLASMDRRARLQLRLQQTVEGLSVAAITYYLVGLIYYLTSAAEDTGLLDNASVWTGLSVPVVFLAISYGTYIVKRRLKRDDGDD